MISDKACIYGDVKIGKNVRIDDFAIITGNVTIGDNVHVGCFCFLSGGEGITIGDYVGISPRTSMFTASDDYSGPSLNNPTIPDEYKPGLQRGPIVIGRHCLIGAHTVILPWVTMGEGSSVGAFGLVIKDLTPWTVYFGIPVRAVKERSKKILDLQRIYEGL